MLGVLAAAILLLLMPWPMAMMLASAIGLVVSLIVFRDRKLRGGPLAAAIGLAVVAAIAMAILLSRSP